MRRSTQTVLILGFTAVFAGYLSVWLRGPGAGLSFLGVEMAEWFKFLGLGARRDLFYLPPITLGLMLSIWTVTWPARESRGWRAWVVRFLAAAVSLLAFPAVEDITGTVREQYVLRVALITLVMVVALASAFWRPQGSWRQLPWLLIALLGVAGAALPAWLFAQVQPFLSNILGVTVGAGIGFWLNLLGNVLVVGVCFYQLFVNRSLLQP